MDTLSAHKRPRPVSPASSSPDGSSTSRTTPGNSAAATNSASSAFRNVSACNRCRLRKNKCDQNLPACTSCEKAGVKCVGYDPITKREIPRAYVYYLESRVTYLEELLSSNAIAFAAADDFEVGTKSMARSASPGSPSTDRLRPTPPPPRSGVDEKNSQDVDHLNKLVSNIGMVSVQGTSDPRYLGSTSGISFARVVFAAVRNSISGSTSDRAGLRAGRAPPTVATTAASAGNSSNFRDSFFGLQSKPAFKKAPFPVKELGAKLVKLYFEHANPQCPILHRGEFMALFNRTYTADDDKRSQRELYMLNIVFAIGAGTFMDLPEAEDAVDGTEEEPTSPKSKRAKTGLSQGLKQAQPEQYHSSAMVHLEYFLSSSQAADRPEGFGGSLEELQAVLLLASFALLRPVAPGLWYIVGVAMRLAVDLGLHHEDGAEVHEGPLVPEDVSMGGAGGHRPSVVDSREKGRREWIRDLRRRLWWCVYSFDRLVSTCVGRPLGITDQVVTTEFPSLLDDNYITTSGFKAGVGHDNDPSYKRVAHHYFRLRLLQSEILQVLQYRQAKQARDKGRNRNNHFMHTKLRSPFLEPHENNFKLWRRDIDRRLWEWKESAPTQRDTTVSFSVYFLELNYYQAVIMLYRQSLHVPPELDGEISPSSEIASPMERPADEDEEDDDEVFLKVAEAGQKVLKLYMLLHKGHVVNYTFLATHHLFMAGIAFLYAIWHSAAVRAVLTIDDVDYTVLAGTTVLRGLTKKCPPAEACRDAFDRMAKATVHMCLSTTGFGSRPAHHPSGAAYYPDIKLEEPQHPLHLFQAQDAHGAFRPQRPRPTFDYSMRDMFPDDTPEIRGFRNLGRTTAAPMARQPMQQQQQQQQATQLQNSMPMPSQQPPPSQPVAMPLTSTPPNLPLNMAATPSSPAGAALFGSPTAGSHFPANHVSPFAPHPQAHPHLQTHQLHMHGGPTSFPDAPQPGAPDASLTAGLYDALGFSNDLDALLGEHTAAYSGHGGLSLGFDTDHDWNDGWGPDFMDGYWFGGPGGFQGGDGGVGL